MSIIKTGITTHDTTCATLEMTRQVSVSAAIAAGGNPAAAIKAAEIAFYRAVVASCVSNGLSYSNFEQALRDLGTGGV